MPLADLAVAEGVDFSDEVEGYKGVKRRLKDKLKKLGWELFQHDKEARLKRVGV